MKLQTSHFLSPSELPDVVDGQFLDSHGQRLRHGDWIRIEGHYCYPQFKNLEGLVIWEPKMGRYRFMIANNNFGRSMEDFASVISFIRLEKPCNQQLATSNQQPKYSPIGAPFDEPLDPG